MRRCEASSTLWKRRKRRPPQPSGRAAIHPWIKAKFNYAFLLRGLGTTADEWLTGCAGATRGEVSLDGPPTRGEKSHWTARPPVARSLTGRPAHPMITKQVFFRLQDGPAKTSCRDDIQLALIDVPKRC